MALDPEIGEDEAFEQLFDLLRSIAAGKAADRSEAVSYSTCRGALLSLGRPHLLPGFLLQCMSVARFRDFITLYEPDPDERERLIRNAFNLARQRLDILGSFDAPQSQTSESSWVFE